MHWENYPISDCPGEETLLEVVGYMGMVGYSVDAECVVYN